MTPEQEAKVDRLMVDVSHIKKAIGGNHELGSKGISATMEEHGKKIAQYENDRAKIVGFSAAVSALAAWFGTFLINLFTKHQ